VWRPVSRVCRKDNTPDQAIRIGHSNVNRLARRRPGTREAVTTTMNTIKIVSVHSLPAGKYHGTMTGWNVRVCGKDYELDGGIRGTAAVHVKVDAKGIATVELV